MSNLDLGNYVTLTHTLMAVLYLCVVCQGVRFTAPTFPYTQATESFPVPSKSCKTDSLQTCMWAEILCRDFTSPSAQFTYVLHPLCLKH
jgi:hypothetical protein